MFHDQKFVLAKYQHLITIWERDISTVMLQILLQILLLLSQFKHLELRENYKDLYGVIGA